MGHKLLQAFPPWVCKWILWCGLSARLVNGQGFFWRFKTFFHQPSQGSPARSISSKHSSCQAFIKVVCGLSVVVTGDDITESA